MILFDESNAPQICVSWNKFMIIFHKSGLFLGFPVYK